MESHAQGKNPNGISWTTLESECSLMDNVKIRMGSHGQGKNPNGVSWTTLESEWSLMDKVRKSNGIM